MPEKYMNLALLEAKKAFEEQEVPVGAVLVYNGEVIASAHNACEANKDATCHAEMSVIRDASKKIGNWRLRDCTLYVTMEPCPMCAGAILHARIPKLVFGVKDPAKGAFGSVLNLNQYPLGFKTDVVGGCEEADCHQLLSHFFALRR